MLFEDLVRGLVTAAYLRLPGKRSGRMRRKKSISPMTNWERFGATKNFRPSTGEVGDRSGGFVRGTLAAPVRLTMRRDRLSNASSQQRGELQHDGYPRLSIGRLCLPLLKSEAKGEKSDRALSSMKLDF